jgi:Ca-activated chloride channel family protein
MDWDGKIDKAREGLKRVLGLLNEDDYLSITTFSGDATVELNATQWSGIDADSLRSTIDGFETRGGTDIYGGLEKARDTISSLPDSDDAVKEILLVTDGEDNRKEAEDFESLATDINQSYGMSVVAAGVGSDYDQATVKTIGENSAGRWEHVSGADELLQFMGQEVDEMESTVIANPELKINPATGVELSEVKRRLPQVQEVDVYQEDTPTVKLPNLMDEEEQKVTMKMGIPGKGGGTHSLATFSLVVDSDTVEEELEITYTDDTEKQQQRNDTPYLEHRDTVLRTQLSEGNVDEATKIADEMEAVAGETDIVNDAKGDTELVEQADDEEELKGSIGEATKIED